MSYSYGYGDDLPDFWNHYEEEKYKEEKRKMEEFEGMTIEELKRLRNIIDTAIKDHESLPKEPRMVGSVVTFTKKFSGDKSYLYAAIRARNGYWSVTGRSGLTNITWGELLNFVKSEERYPRSAINTVKTVGV